METYNLRDLLKFLLDQQQKGFQDINTLIHILRSDKLEPTRKRFTIVTGLRECGLRCTEHSNSEMEQEDAVGNFELTETVEMRALTLGKGQPVSFDLVAHKMDNGVLRFRIICN